MQSVPIQAVAFLGAVGGFLLILVLFFLYLNKALCFANCGGFPCIDKVPKKDKSQLNPEGDQVGVVEIVADPTDRTGSAYQYDDDSSSDSDEEILKNYQVAKRASISQRGSMRSIKSSASRKSLNRRTHLEVGKDQNGGNAGLSLAEQGDVQDIVSVGSAEGGGKSNHATASFTDEEGGTSVKTQSQADAAEPIMYENQAFLPESADSRYGSEPLLSSTDRMSNDEHLFDVSDLQQHDTLISKCGSLEMSFKYEAKLGKMTITVHQAKEIPAKDRGGANSIQVRLMLLPTKKQKFKTKVKTSDSPVFDETFSFNKIFPDNVVDMGVRVRLYGLERMRRERMIGEAIVGFVTLNTTEETTQWVVLEPRSNLSQGDSGFDVSSLSRSDSASSTQSLQHGGMPELLLGLGYNGTTGRLSVEVIKGSNFRNMAMNRAPDTYVKLTLMSPTGQELQRCKTSVRRGQPSPLFKETFVFQVALFQLPDVTLMVSVYNKKTMKKKEMIGWFSLGMNSSGEEEQSHWDDMRENKGDQVCRWHVLLES